FVTMFLDEAKLSARITHPNVVHVEELGQRGTFYYLVMEYVHGCSLSQLVRALRGRGRRLTPELATYVAIQTADGLHAAHETVGDDGELLGVVHRDISPQNVLLSYRGHTKLIDFGVAKARGRTQHTTVSSLKGKLRYMAPEQASSQPVDRRTDVYALGIVLWELLTMRTLFKAENDLKLHDLVKNPVVEPPSKFVEGIPPELDAVVMRALARDPNDRPASAQEFRRMLANALPAALAVESEQLAELLCVVMADTIRDQHRRLPETISKALKREVGDALDREPGAEDPRELELLGTLTTSASHLIGTDGSTVESRGSQSVSMAQAEPMPQAPWQSQAVEPELDHEAPPRAKWVRWVAVVAVLAMIGVVAALFGGGDPQAVTPRGTETRSATEGSVPAATSPSTASSGAAAVAPTEAAPAVESPTPAPAAPENPAPAASSGR
ncbi:MAG: serine/threonine protein kinase, partial [Myxococcales bacterium]|nr:serine/threonine protein kinase [Myxococcales bacterium]